MDPGAALGAAASAVQLAHLALSTILGNFKAVKDARADILSLTASLDSLQAVIHDLRSREHATSALRILTKPVDPSDEEQVHITPLQALEREMNRLRVKLSISRSRTHGAPSRAGGSTTITRRMVWPFEAGEVLEIIGSIEQYKLLFAAALEAETAESAIEVEAAIDDIRARMRELKSIQRTAVEALRAAEDKIPEIQNALRSSQKTICTTHSTSTLGLLQDQLDIYVQLIEYDRLERAMNLRERVLGWLCPEMHDKRHRDISRQRENGTGNWLVEMDEFVAWESGTAYRRVMWDWDTPEAGEASATKRILWGHGILGSGKTFLSSRVIDHLLKNDEYAVTYICFDSAQTSGHEVSFVLASLIAQLVSQQAYLNPLLVRQYHKYTSRREKPPDDELFTILLVIVQDMAPSRVFVVCDALDECSAECRQSLMSRLVSMAENGLSLFLTSRPHPADVNDALRDYPKIDLAAREEDIRLYVTSKIKNDNNAQEKILGAMRSLNPPPDGAPEEWIAEKLISLSEGMFLLARFLVDLVRNCSTPQQILNELAHPEGEHASTHTADWLDVIYGRVVETIQSLPPARRRIAIRTISWLTHDHPPQHSEWRSRWYSFDTTPESIIRTAVSIEPGVRELSRPDVTALSSLVDACAGLVVSYQGCRNLRLAHRTVNEYFKRHPIVSRQVAHTVFANAWATFLALDIFNVDEEAVSQENSGGTDIDRFHSNVVRRLGYYIKSTNEPEVQETVMEFLERRQCVIKFLKKVAHISPEDKHDTLYLALHAAAFIGHGGAVQELLEKGADQTPEPLGDVTPLYLASDQGHENVVCLLLKHGISPDAPGMNPLLAASQRGHEDVAHLLLDHGASTTPTDSSGNTSLLIAISSEKESIVRCLLHHGADVSSPNHRGTTPLLRACSSGHENLVRLFLEHGASVAEVDNNGNTCLSLACWNGHYSAAKILLDHGAEVDAVNNDGVTPLRRAIDEEHEDVIKLLLLYGANVNMFHNDNFGHPLYQAVCGERENIVRLLLDKGAMVNIVNGIGATPLLFASNRRCEVVVRLLLAYGADPAIPDEDDDLPIHCAVKQNHIGIVEALLEHGSQVSPSDKSGTTPLLNAASNGNEDIVRILIQHGASVTERSPDGMTALNHAVDRVNESLIRFLLEQGADPSITDHARRHVPLSSATKSAKQDIVRDLLDHGANVSSPDYRGSTPLLYACGYGYDGLTRLLLDRGASVAETDSDGNTCLSEACLNGRYFVVKILLEHGADVNTVNNYGATPLMLAVDGGREDIVELLLTSGANVNVCTNDGVHNPLRCASGHGREGIVRLLLKHGAKVNTPNGTETTRPLAANQGPLDERLLLAYHANHTLPETDDDLPIHCAVRQNHVDVVKLLLEHGSQVSPPNKSGMTPLLEAAKNGNEEIARLLIQHGAFVAERTEDGTTALDKAVHSENENLVRFLLEQGADPSINDYGGQHVPLCCAIEGKCTGIVKLLLDYKADIDASNSDGSTPLALAFDCGADDGGRLDAIRFLLEQGAGAYRNGDSVLTGTPCKGNEELAQLLLDHGASVGSTLWAGASSLVLAARRGDEAIVRLLLERGADPNLADSGEDSPLHCCASDGYLPVVRLLLEGGSNPSAGNNSGSTPLHVSARACHTEVVKLLLEHGADEHAIDKNCDTVLHSAARGGDEEIVRILLKRGHNFTILNLEGESPEVLAHKFEKAEAARLLQEWPAFISLPDSPEILPLQSDSPESLNILSASDA